MEVVITDIESVKILRTKRFEDDRGFFSEVYNEELSEIIEMPLVQDNHSYSKSAATLRGLHFQLPPYEQGKLVRVIQGSVIDVAVDLRRSSATYLKHVCIELSRQNWSQLWIPPGFAHGFLTLEPHTELIYKVTKPYSRAHDRGVLWSDPEIAIAWPELNRSPILSEKDQALPLLCELENPF